MSRKTKIFTLIKGEPVHLGPGTKVIKASDFGAMLSAEEMLQQVKEDADAYVRKVTEEAETIKEQAQQQGFEEGFRQWTEQIAYLEEEIKKVRADVQKTVIPVALSAAKKIVGQELELSEDVIVAIVTDNLKAVSQHSFIKIFVHPSESEIIELRKEELKNIFESLESLKILPRKDIEKGGCVIETEAGIINAQLGNRLTILEQAFQRAFQEPEEA